MRDATKSKGLTKCVRGNGGCVISGCFSIHHTITGLKSMVRYVIPRMSSSYRGLLYQGTTVCPKNVRLGSIYKSREGLRQLLCKSALKQSL